MRMFSLSARTHGALLLLTELARLSADEVAGAVLMMLQSARTSQLHELVLRPASETNYG